MVYSSALITSATFYTTWLQLHVLDKEPHWPDCKRFLAEALGPQISSPGPPQALRRPSAGPPMETPLDRGKNELPKYCHFLGALSELHCAKQHNTRLLLSGCRRMCEDVRPKQGH